MNNEFPGDRGGAFKESHFAKHNRALLEQLRAPDATDRTPAGDSVIAANNEGEQLAYRDGRSLAALSLAPLVAIAWAEGDMGDAQRNMVLERASELGLRPADSAYRLLEGWLAQPRTRELLATWKRYYVDALALVLPHEAKRELKRDILDRARAIADVAGALAQTLPSAKRAVMKNIERAFP
ncbi:MAG: hypothetical protein ABI607_10620 [Betaproteobacteria bacterium]